MKRRTFHHPKGQSAWHRWMSAFVALSGLVFAIGALQYGAHQFPAQAASGDNMMGWIWDDATGWTSANNLNPSACGSGSCGTYGIRIDPATRQLTGWAWNDYLEWMCFGSTCDAVAQCSNDPADPLGTYNAPDGFAPRATLNAGAGVVEVRGWAKICKLGTKGWISLNCTDPGNCGGAYAYKMRYNTATKAFYTGAHSPPLPANNSSLGWNGFSDGTGLGYFDFQYLTMNTANEGTITPTSTICADGIDNDLNGVVDCADSSCSANAACTAETPANGNCFDGTDNDTNGIKDCAETACRTAFPVQCAETTSNGTICANAVDDDGDGLGDCADPGCVGYPGCPAGESSCVNGMGVPQGSAVCCHDGGDNDANGQSDCSDASCQINEPSCTPAWLSTRFGNVYAQQGIQGDPTKVSTAQYCLSSQGTISGFSSDAACVESSSNSLSLPNSSTGYKGTLGSLDIPGILAGRYGQVIELGANVDVTAVLGAANVLGGKVYHATGNVTLGGKTFNNASGATAKGSGLLLVEGDLRITGDISYASTAGINYLRNLASLGVIVKKGTGGTGGNITILPNVQNLVGVYFSEDTINTGTNCPGVSTCLTDQPLTVLGIMAAKKFNLERNYRDPARAAEEIKFDGRGVANPPPGMQDIGKSLPSSKDAF